MEVSLKIPTFENRKVFVDISFADIVPWFIDNRKQDIKRIREFVEVSDFDQIQRMGHRWKGTCASYGFEQLSRTGELLESCSVSQKREEILKLLEQVTEYINKLEIVYTSPGENNNSNEFHI